MDYITLRGIDPTKALALWRKDHTGPDCAPCDRKETHKARRKAKKQERQPVEPPKEQMSLF